MADNKNISADSFANLNYESLIESSPNPIFSLDREYRYTTFNRAHANVMKALYGADIRIGHPLSEYQKIPADWKMAKANLDCVLAGETTHASGWTGGPETTRKYFDVHNFPVYAKTGEVIGILVFAIDTTERKRAEENVQKSEERHRTILQTAMDGFWLVDMQGHLLEVNEAYCKMSGYSQAELLKLRITDLEACESLEETAQHIEKLSKEGADRFESQHRRKDGSIFDVEVSIKYLPGEVPLGMGFFRDITEGKKIDRAIRESEYFFKESQKAAFIGSYKTDFIKGYWESSEVLDQIFGIDCNYNRSVQGWLDIVHPDDMGMMGQYLQDEVISKRKPFDKEYRIIRKSDNAVRWVRGLGQIEFDKNSNVISMIGTIQDITEYKSAQAQLIHSSKLASIGTLAAGVAHEINNPLAIIMGFTEKMLHTFQDSSHQDEQNFLQKIRNATSRIADIVRGLRDYARQDSDKIDNVDMHLCIMETISLVKGIYAKENIQIETQLNAKDCCLKLNMGKMQQVLMNIIGNAKDALNNSPDGTIRISTQNKDNGLLIEIADNGPGIPANVSPRIFDAFFTTKAPGKGTGLGLSISHTIITSFGGTIKAESWPSVGTVFKIFLPNNQK